MSDRLDRIVAKVRQRLEERRPHQPESEWVAQAAALAPALSLRQALRRPGKATASPAPLRVIGELKRKSPSAGMIHGELDASAVAPVLARAGCQALSVLTEPDFFGGSLETLREVRRVVHVPLLRKDFIVDPYQVHEARAHGADAVLLLAAVLDDSMLERCADAAARWGMDVLAESHGPRELERILRLEFPIVGINARDLTTFEVDLDGALEAARDVPLDRVLVAESGVRTADDAKKVARAGVDATLVGEGLMRGGDPGRAYRSLFSHANQQ